MLNRLYICMLNRLYKCITSASRWINIKSIDFLLHSVTYKIFMFSIFMEMIRLRNFSL